MSHSPQQILTTGSRQFFEPHLRLISV